MYSVIKVNTTAITDNVSKAIANLKDKILGNISKVLYLAWVSNYFPSYVFGIEMSRK